MAGRIRDVAGAVDEFCGFGWPHVQPRDTLMRGEMGDAVTKFGGGLMKASGRRQNPLKMDRAEAASSTSMEVGIFA
jgi:hypothetical protein